MAYAADLTGDIVAHFDNAVKQENAATYPDHYDGMADVQEDDYRPLTTAEDTENGEQKVERPAKNGVSFNKRLKDGTDGELGLFYYLFAAHHWTVRDLRDLWEGPTRWWDLIHALSSYEAEQRSPDQAPRVRHLDKKRVKLTRAK